MADAPYNIYKTSDGWLAIIASLSGTGAVATAPPPELIDDPGLHARQVANTTPSTRGVLGREPARADLVRDPQAGVPCARLSDP
jgi:formyl-CoA transferase